MESKITLITRRKLLKWGGLTLGGALTGGIWSRVWDYLLDGRDLTHAYPSTLLSIEEYTKGRVKVGMEIFSDNVDLVKDLLSQGCYTLVKKYGKRIKIGETTTDPYKLVYRPFLEATERNRGQAILDKKGQLWTKEPGKPWIGGIPFPNPNNGLEAIWNHTFSHYDDIFWDANPDLNITIRFDEKGKAYGKIREKLRDYYRSVKTIGRVAMDPKPHIPEFSNDLYRTHTSFAEPYDLKNLQILIIMPYKGDVFNDLWVYAPSLRRGRKISTYERFESPSGEVLFIADYVVFNDPVLNWSYKVIDKKPMLAPLDSFVSDPKNVKEEFTPYSVYQLRPEVLIYEAYPTAYPRAPYSKKVLYTDMASQVLYEGDFYDRAGKLWKFYGRDIDSHTLKDGAGYPKPDTNTHYCIDFFRGECTWRLCNKPGGRLHNFGLETANWFTPASLNRLKY